MVILRSPCTVSTQAAVSSRKVGNSASHWHEQDRSSEKYHCYCYHDVSRWLLDRNQSSWSVGGDGDGVSDGDGDQHPHNHGDD